MKLLTFIILALFLATLQAAAVNRTHLLWPKPTSFSYDPQGLNVTVSPCDVKYAIHSLGQNSDSVDIIIKQHLKQNYNCQHNTQAKHTLNIHVKNLNHFISTDIIHERYQLQLIDKFDWHLKSDYYVGFVRGFQTFFQLFEREKEQHFVRGLPIIIEDGPQFLWRGLMIDTSRHYLPVDTIKKAIRGIAYSKLNVLHWHIVDEDSFPLIIPTVPQLSDSGQVGGVYTPQNVLDVISYARIYGISVVIQIDTPAHTQSWGRSDKYKDIAITCNGKYMGQLDPTIDLTWQVLTNVLNHLQLHSLSDYVHFGGDEVTYDCWNITQINDYMATNNIPDYFGLSVDFRQRQKKLWRTISQKKVIYWANEDIDLPVQNDDLIQWWGVSTNVDRMAGRPNQIILSNYDLTYLDIGFGNIYGDDYGTFETWRTMYAFQPRINNVNVIGGETAMWNELGSKHTFEQKVMLRSSVIAERLWNDNVDIKVELNNVATRLTAHAARLRQLGFKVWPVTVGICQKNLSICF